MRGWQDGAPSLAIFNFPTGLAQDGAGDLYGAREGLALTYGLNSACAQVALLASGLGAASSYAPHPHLPVSEPLNNRIRRVSPAGVVSTFVGSGVAGWLDGAGTTAQLNSPQYMAFDTNGTLYIADSGARGGGQRRSPTMHHPYPVRLSMLGGRVHPPPVSLVL